MFCLQDNNGVIGLIEPMKKCTLPVKVPVDKPVVKIASGEFSAGLCHILNIYYDYFLTYETLMVLH